MTLETTKAQRDSMDNERSKSESRAKDKGNAILIFKSNIGKLEDYIQRQFDIIYDAPVEKRKDAYDKVLITIRDYLKGVVSNTNEMEKLQDINIDATYDQGGQ